MSTENTGSAEVRRAFTRFGFTWAVGCLVLTAAAVAFTRSRHFSLALAAPMAIAFLTEFTFYLLLGFASIREYLRQTISPARIAAGLGASAAVPYLVYSVPAGVWRPGQCALWIAVACLVSFFFLFRPNRFWLRNGLDIVFLAGLAALILSGLLRWIFPTSLPRVPADVLGHITLLRTAMLACLLIRGVEDTGIGLIPSLRDLSIGALWFVIAGVVAVPLGRVLGELRLTGRTPNPWQAAALVLGFFWVVALSEEFFFRGLLQQWLTRWTRSTAAGLILASLLFAACHLSFRGFPNWRIATLSAVLGLTSGGAFLQARSIRASMVTHALAVGAWRLFLS